MSWLDDLKSRLVWTSNRKQLIKSGKKEANRQREDIATWLTYCKASIKSICPRESPSYHESDFDFSPRVMYYIVNTFIRASQRERLMAAYVNRVSSSAAYIAELAYLQETPARGLQFLQQTRVQGHGFLHSLTLASLCPEFSERFQGVAVLDELIRLNPEAAKLIVGYNDYVTWKVQNPSASFGDWIGTRST